MPSPRWRKVAQDLKGNPTRTALVVLSIAVGVFAIGMVYGANETLGRDLREGYASTKPPSATLFLRDALDQDTVEAVRGMRGVAAAEGRRQLTVRARVGAGEWKTLSLIGIPDFKDVRVDRPTPEAGAWPPPLRALVLERASLPHLGARVGDRISVELGDGKRKELRVAGTAHHFGLPPPIFAGGRAHAFVSLDTLEWLGEPRDFNRLAMVVAEGADDRKHIEAVAAAVRDRLEKSGHAVSFTWVPEPGKHPMDNAFEALMTFLKVLGYFTLALGGFLVTNTLSATLAQQVRQIGVMKAIGARTAQLVGMYLAMVAAYGLLALLVGVPLGALGARGLAAFTAGFANMKVGPLSIPPRLMALEVAVGLLMPLLASLIPVLAGARVTVREALSDYGVTRLGLGGGWIDRVVGRVRGLSRPLLLSLRNTFRRKGRLALTLVTLTLGGAIFISVFSVRASAVRTIRDAFEYWNYDVEVNLGRSYRAAEIELEAMRVPGVARVESWGFMGATRTRPDGTDGESLSIVAPQPGTDLIRPTVLAGRWLLPGDENAAVVNTDLLRSEPDIRVGDDIVLKVAGKESRWRVVGTVQGLLTGRIAYVNYPYFARRFNVVGRAGSLYLVTQRHDADFQARVAKDLQQRFRRMGIRVGSVRTTNEHRRAIADQFDILVAFLLIMAALLAVVGGLGLMGTMSINVLERTREIGVMRAIGASNGSVMRIFLVEGMLIGAMSWLLALAVALPVGKALTHVMGIAFIRVPFHYTFSAAGALLWLALSTVLAAFASFLPAWNAARLTVRDVLAYE